VSHKIALGVGIDYPRPETIGADRLANATAVVTLYGSPAVVVDFGTAVTFDVISRAGNYVGGVIAPGLNAMTDYLHRRTALLPRVKLREPRHAVGRSTAEAMRSGAVHGYRGLVAEILRQILKEIGSVRPAHLIATGGDAKLIAGRSRLFSTISPTLTLEGLRLIGCRNFPE
jgi:type III pantothenate kinase